MTRVDSAVLNLAEGLCQRFQLLTGRTNVWLALQLTNLSIIVYFVWAGLQFLSSDAGNASRHRGVLRRIVVCADADRLQSSRSKPTRTAPTGGSLVASGIPERVRDLLLRILFLTLTFALLWPIVSRLRLLSVPLGVRQQPSYVYGRPHLLPGGADDGGLVPVGVRSTSTVCGEGHGVVARVGAGTS